jgi:glycine C-acetyltransferase
MQSLDEFAIAKLAQLERSSLRRALVDTTRLTGIWVLRNGRRLLSFCCNDYLNLSHHPAVKEAAIAALRSYGVGAGASRLVSGNHPLLGELEARLARLKETEAACVFGSGYLANLGIIPALIGPGDLILIDELAHACLWAGARLAQAAVVPYRHADVAHAGALIAELRQRHRRALIATDGVFSMDGYLAQLDTICDLGERHDALVMVDDSHAVGVVGAGGRGTHEHHDVVERIDILTGTLGKAIGGASGGYVSGRREIIELLRQRSRPYLFSNSLAPPVVGASLRALELIESSHELRDRLRDNTARFRARMTELGFDLLPGEHPIVPVMVGDEVAAASLSAKLVELGVYAVSFSFPVVPRGTARIRTQMSSAHTPEDLDFAADQFAAARAALAG